MLIGDERRFCGKCGKDVHAISELNRAEAERVLDLARSGRLCVRVEHSTDGTVHFKKQDPSGITGRRGPFVSAAVGASLLIAG